MAIEEFTDVFFTEQPSPSVMYRTDMVVCQEALIKGQYVGRSWNAVGYLGPDNECFPTDTHWGPQAFWLEIDGQLLSSHWEWRGCTQSRDARGLTVTVELCHAVRPVSVGIHTLLDGTPVLTRWLSVTNMAENRSSAISAASSCAAAGRSVDGVLVMGRLLPIGWPVQLPAEQAQPPPAVEG